MKQSRFFCALVITAIFALFCSTAGAASDGACNDNAIVEEEVFTPVGTILQDAPRFLQTFVTVKGVFRGWRKAPGSPPVSRSDWVIEGDDGVTIYVTGLMPDNLRPDDPTAQGKHITVLAQVLPGPTGRPYLLAHSVRHVLPQVETMVSVSQILFNPLQMRGKLVGIHGVLTKGFDSRGMRLYLIADPTGALLLGRLPKLYPTGTILRVRGTVSADENGLPSLENIEIVSARP